MQRVSYPWVIERAKNIARLIGQGKARTKGGAQRRLDGRCAVLCPVPRAGWHVLPLVLQFLMEAGVPARVSEIEGEPDDYRGEHLIFLDDIVDSGATRARCLERHPGASFFALIDKTSEDARDWCRSGSGDDWVVFPWEGSASGGVEDNVLRLLQYVGENPNRPGLIDTPKRVAKALKEMTAGYGIDIPSLFTVFEEPADEMVVMRNIDFTSMCEHHMLPFHGVAHVGYVPQGRVIGASKLVRVVDAFSSRLQVQERLTSQVAECLMDHLRPLGVGVVMEAAHECMACRGVRRRNPKLVTSSMLGVMREGAARSEFFSLVR